MIALEVDAIDVHYGDFQALWGVSASVESGGTLAIIGANGAGKSTLLGAIAGSRPLTSGSISFDGRDVSKLPAHARVALGITLVPEGRRLFPSLTVEENLTVGAFRRREGPWSLDRVYELLPIVANLRQRRANQLSGGEQQAVAIGRALMNNPSLLLLDEVSLGLAPVIVQSLYAILPDVSAEGTTVLLVEQDVGQALAAADRVQCLLEGRVTLEGDAKDLDRDSIRAAYFGV
ncbi:MAG: ABC transporter ATP-binding protein [Solirubrobacteraceae bacterium]